MPGTKLLAVDDAKMNGIQLRLQGAYNKEWT